MLHDQLKLPVSRLTVMAKPEQSGSPFQHREPKVINYIDYIAYC